VKMQGGMIHPSRPCFPHSCWR